MSVEITTLANGMRVVSDSMDAVETVSVGVWVGVGARFERPTENGISHLLEHMAFKGTKRRSALAIAEEMDAVGGHLNAYTSRENTAYYAKVLKDDLALAVDIIADILQHSTLDEEELERERAVIIQEINQANDTPDEVVFDRFQETAFPGQAIGRPVLGSVDLVRGIGRDTIAQYMADHYSAERMVLSAAGRVDHGRLVELAEEKFRDLPARTDHIREHAQYAGGDSRENKDLEQVQLVIGFEGLPFEDPDFFASSVFSTAFGGGMSSRLFQEVREKRGLAYSVYSFHSSYFDGGLFGIYAGTGEAEVRELVPVVCDELQKICENVTDQEIERARAQIKAGILMSMESTSSRCEQKARQILVYGRPLTVEEVVKKVVAVDAAAVRNFASRLKSSTPTLAALGPIGQLESFDQVSKRLSN
ncbi:MAG: insulinase family protein [Rhodospirillales bacterium]|nr:insulinase family protein [Rhodospirillales bacterium]